MTPSLGIEAGPHWLEASALTTAPSLLRLMFLWLDTLLTCKGYYQWQGVAMGVYISFVS